jgi:hypothetical protein
MLFDLRGRGRRRTVQAIYLALALLLGVGLVGLGIGSNSSGGGILDALKGGDGGGSRDKELDKDLKAATAKATANPKNPGALAELTRLRVQRANLETDTKKAAPRLELASQSWEDYLALDVKKPDGGLASLMVKVYSDGLNQPVKAVRAMEIVTAETKPPSAGLYSRLAELAYQAGETRVGDLATDRAVELAEPKDKKPLRAFLEQRKTQGTGAQQGQPAQPGS